MTTNHKALLRAINPCPGFLLTRDQMEEMQRLVKELIAENERLAAALPRWISTDEHWPDETESVTIAIDGNVYPAFWQEEQEGDWENGYKHFRQWYYTPDWDKFEPLDFYVYGAFLWQSFPKPPDTTEPKGEPSCLQR